MCSKYRESGNKVVIVMKRERGGERARRATPYNGTRGMGEGERGKDEVREDRALFVTTKKWELEERDNGERIGRACRVAS